MAPVPALLPAHDLDAEVRRGFRRAHGREPDRVGRAPGRVNLIGEHTDYNGGRCLPLALPHQTFVAVAGRDDSLVRVTSTATGSWEGERLGPGEVTGWPAYVAGVVWALREDGVDVPGLDVHVDSAVPVGAGLSSSAAVECALAVAVAPGVDRDRLRDACVRAENEVAGAPTGGMDQAVALHARARHALLLDFADGSRRPVRCDPGADRLALLVVDTGVGHALVDGGYGDRRAECVAAGRALGRPLHRASSSDVARLPDRLLRRRARHVVTENQRVDRAASALASRRWEDLGRLLDASHASLRDDFEVSSPELDTVVRTARAHGALGARMTGGGFGGSAVALVPQLRLVSVMEAVAARARTAGFHPTFLRADPPGPAATESSYSGRLG